MERYIKVTRLAGSELTDELIDSLLSEGEWLVRDEGGTILPMFNDFVNAGTKKLKGYVNDIGNDMSNGYIATRVWLDA